MDSQKNLKKNLLIAEEEKKDDINYDQTEFKKIGTILIKIDHLEIF